MDGWGVCVCVCVCVCVFYLLFTLRKVTINAYFEKRIIEILFDYNKIHPFKVYNAGWVWRLTPVIPTFWEAEAGELPEPRRQRLR